MHRSTAWRRKQKASIGLDSKIDSQTRKGPKDCDGSRNIEWHAFAGAVLANLIKHGEVVHGWLKENRENDWPENLLYYVEPPVFVVEALKRSKIPPSSLAYAAAEFGRVTVRRGRLNPLSPRRENSRATYWKSIPWFSKELACYCRNRAPKRQAAADLIRRLSGLKNRPAHRRENESHHWIAEKKNKNAPGLPSLNNKDKTPLSLLAPHVRRLLPNESAIYVDRLIDRFFDQNVQHKEDLPKLYRYGAQLLRKVLSAVGTPGDTVPETSIHSPIAAFTNTETHRGDDWSSIEKWEHADEIDRRLGWKDE